MAGQAPLSKDRIESAMRDALQKQDELTDQYRLDVDAQAKAEAAFKEAFAIVRLTTRTLSEWDGVKMNEKIAEDKATKDTAALRLETLLANAKEAATRQSLHSVRLRLESLRTLAANYREAGV